MTNEQLKERHDLIDTLNGITDKDSFLMQIGNVFDEFEVTHTEFELILEKAAELRCKTETKRLYSKAKMLEMLYSAPVPYITIDGNNKEKVSPERLADYIESTENYFFVQSSNSEDGRLFWYKDGVYNHISKSLAKGYIKDIISKYNRDLATIKAIDETFKQMQYSHSSFHVVEDDKQLNSNYNLINFENGMLNLETLELDSHSPEYKSTIQIPCKWCSEPAPTPVFDKYIKHLAAEEPAAEQTLLEMIGFAISNIPIKFYKKSLFIIGEGNSGKTQFPNLLTLLIGSKNSCAMPFSKLEGRFQIANLYNKRLAVDDDCKNVNGYELSNFKSMTGGGQLDGERKNEQDAAAFEYNGLYIVLANNLPLFGGDKGKHVYDRIIPIQSGAAVPENERDPKLLEKLYAERSGIITKAVQALKNTIDNGYKFTIGDNSRHLLQRYQIENDSCLMFFDECCMKTENAKTACNQAQMWTAFRDWCKLTGEYCPKRKEFTRAMADKCGIPESRLTVYGHGGKRCYPYTLTADAKEELHIFDGTPQQE